MTDASLPSNWGRWGTDDQLGTLHLIDAAATLRAAAEVCTGRHVSLARPVAPVPFTAAGGPVGVATRMPAAVLQTIGFGGTDPMAMTDTLIVNTHNAALTHLDALAHIPIDRQVYPGVPLDEAVTPLGVRHGSADPFGSGIVTRGVLLDLAPDDVPLRSDHRITDADLDAALERAATGLHPGDAIAVRANWNTDRPMGEPVPGLDHSAVRWLHSHDVSVYVGDVGDPRPPIFPLPLHQVALARLGLPLVDAAELHDLAAACRAEQRASFLLALAPPPITGATGLPVNPVAIF
jgi:kynurenine formamidase